MDLVVLSLDENFFVALKQWIIDIQSTISDILGLFHIDLLIEGSQYSIVDDLSEEKKDFVVKSCMLLTYKLTTLYNYLSDIETKYIKGNINEILQIELSEWIHKINPADTFFLNCMGIIRDTSSVNSDISRNVITDMNEKINRLHEIIRNTNLFHDLIH